jgi:acyl carrier protein
MSEDLERRVIELIAQKARRDSEQITLDTKFADLNIDSLDGMELMFTFEDEFKVDIPDNQVRAMQNVRQVTEGLKLLIALKANPQAAPTGEPAQSA